MRIIAITGGAGFIGSHVARLFVTKYPNYKIINIDKLTYAGNLENVEDLTLFSNYFFERVDILDQRSLLEVFKKYNVNSVIHLAAESHVDRSITNPLDFVTTNILGTVNLLNTARDFWKGREEHLFYHISTDEVFGSLGDSGYFKETTSYDPKSPYSASKAGSDHFVRAYYNTYGLKTIISNCSNNYGPYQFPEKLIPLVINNIRNGHEIPVYGKGTNIRDWLYVEDHARAIDLIFHKGTVGDTYNVGGFNEWKNIDLVKTICSTMDSKLDKPQGESEKLIKFVKDRAGHDMRYAIDASKLNNELGWEPSLQFEEGIKRTVNWYLDNEVWLKNITGSYQDYYSKMYKK